MKTIVEKLQVNKNTKTEKILFDEINNESTDDYEFQEFSFENGKKIHNLGFLVCDVDNETVSIISFDKENESADIDSLFCDYDLDVKELLDLHKGTMMSGGPGTRIIRLW